MENYVDLASGEETVPVSAEPCIFETLRNEGFEYSPVNLMTLASNLDPNEICYEGCGCIVLSCEDESSAKTCSCLDRFGGNYITVISDGNPKKILRSIEDHVRGNPAPPVFECNAMCKCANDCINREVQWGVKTSLLVFSCGDGRGFGVRTMEPLLKGQFICEYAGDVLDTAEAEDRSRHKNGHMNYVMGVRERTEEEVLITFIDPQKRGNIGRFINHSCDPNLVMIPVRVDSEIVRLALFARRDIEIEEELTFHYGGCSDSSSCDDATASRLCRKHCLCGSQNCEGYLPFDSTLFPHYTSGK